MSAQVRDASVQNSGFTYFIFNVFILLNFFHGFIFEESSCYFLNHLLIMQDLPLKFMPFMWNRNYWYG